MSRQLLEPLFFLGVVVTAFVLAVMLLGPLL